MITLRGVMAILAVGWAGGVAAQEIPSKPNLIFIMADDLGYGDLGCFGQKMLPTPHLDQLAAEGRKLTNFYAGCTVCRPSRLALWTGRHMGHTPIWSNAAYEFQPSDVTVAEVVREAGYTTGGVGKWAMGGPESSGAPGKNGFDFWMGYLDQSEAHNYYPTHLWRNGEQVPLPGNVLLAEPRARRRVALKRVTWSHEVMTREAFGFIREHKDKPFLLHVHWTIPHANNEGGTMTGDGMEVPDHGVYGDRDWPAPEKGMAVMITRMDADLGRLVALLKELQLERHTLVVFTSDNGPHSEGGHKHEFFDSNGPLRGYKRDLYEGGIRVPTIAWWPGVVEAGTTCAEPLAFWDWLPTACELAGAKAPAGIDGLSFLPALRGKEQQSHESLFWRYENKTALREGKWKAVRTDPGKPIELYDLEADLGEEQDLAAEHPEMVARLARLMAQAVK